MTPFQSGYTQRLSKTINSLPESSTCRAARRAGSTRCTAAGNEVNVPRILLRSDIGRFDDAVVNTGETGWWPIWAFVAPVFIVGSCRTVIFSFFHERICQKRKSSLGTSCPRNSQEFLSHCDFRSPAYGNTHTHFGNKPRKDRTPQCSSTSHCTFVPERTLRFAQARFLL